MKHRNISKTRHSPWSDRYFRLSDRYFEEFFCTHAPLIENHFQKIMSAAEMNINDRNAVAAALLEVKNEQC